MKIINPSVEIEPYDGIKIMKNIERACRTCYRSEGSITDDSYKRLLTNCLNRGHESVLEHEKITIRMVCSTHCYKDLTRHRFGSFSIESTRYCGYNKDKFNGEIKFIRPWYYQDSWNDMSVDGDVFSDNETKSKIWYNTMEGIEKSYMEMAKAGAIPDESGDLLPQCTAAEVTMTANIREWRHILSLRASKFSHPSVQQVMIPLLLDFKKNMPELFDNIEYNTEFPVEKYASISTMK